MNVIKSTEMLTMHNIYGYLTRPSLYLAWHAIDGEVNESGFGDECAGYSTSGKFHTGIKLPKYYSLNFFHSSTIALRIVNVGL